MTRPHDPPGGQAGERSRRLFFALWPDAQLRDHLLQRMRPIAAALAGRPQRSDQWHVTLEFLGSVPESRVAAAREAAAAVRAAPFELILDTVEHWRRAGVLCLTAGQTPPELEGLVAALRAALEARGFVPERRPYRPHVTLARRAPHPSDPVTLDPVHWPVREFVLVESATEPQGSIYTPLDAWPLRP